MAGARPLERVSDDLHGYIERLPVGVFQTTPDGRIVMGNPALAELLGAPDVATLLDLSVRDLYVEPEIRDGFFASSIDGPTQQDIQLRTLDGRTIWARSTSRPISGQDGKIELLEGILEDVTDRYETQQRLADSERLFRTAFLDAPIGMIINSPDLSVVRANPAFLTMVGLPPEADRLQIRALVDHNDIDDIQRRHAAMTGGTLDTYTTDRRLHRPDGTTIPVRLHVSAIRSSDGALQSILTQVVDQSDAVRSEHELRQLARSKDDLVRSVSHELRTPLTTIVGLAAELHDRAGDFSAAERAELTRLLATQADEMADLVDDLLAAARSDVLSLELRLRPTDIADEVRTVTEAWRQGEPALVLPTTACMAKVDPFRLRQIIRNLLSNAHKYGSEPVTVTVESDRPGWCAIHVADAGEGLPESEWEAIFERYYRATDLPGLPGSLGLGLALGRQLARMMSGDLRYRVVDGRSVFTLSLPAA